MDYSRETFESRLRGILIKRGEGRFYNISEELNKEGGRLDNHIYLVPIEEGLSILISSLVSLNTGRVLDKGKVVVGVVERLEGEEVIKEKISVEVDKELFINLEREVLRLIDKKI